jgi:acetolactate synthase-1/2/3 large subunit
MNGAESLVTTLVGGGVDVCFTNPGTSEMHFVAALDRVDGMRSVLCLFEGVVSGAADGYWRMARRPAATLLHLGPGLGNAVANLHNAKKAHSGIVNIVGEHATFHIEHDAPLTADIEGIARPVSHWVHTSRDSTTVAEDGAQAIAEAMAAPGRIATLILPGDTAWNAANGVAAVPGVAPPAKVDEEAVTAAADAAGESCMLLLSGDALTERGLALAGAIAAKTGSSLLAQTSNAVLQRGAGRVPVGRVPFPVLQAVEQLKDMHTVVLVGAKAPVAFFGYPDRPSVVTSDDCEIRCLAAIEEDQLDALERLADRVGARAEDAPVQKPFRPDLPTGAFDLDKLAAILGNTIPENAICVDESVTTGRGFYPLTAGAPPHDWLQNMGGSIGYGGPCAVGAAIACPDRKVLCLQADGSGMYSLQALWTQARESLDVTTVVLANRKYRILNIEYQRVGAGAPGARARSMMDIDNPDLDWVSLANGMGVPACRVTTTDELNRQLAAYLAEPGPNLIEAVI